MAAKRPELAKAYEICRNDADFLEKEIEETISCFYDIVEPSGGKVFACEKCGQIFVDVGVYHFLGGKRVCYDCMHGKCGPQMDAARENGPSMVIGIRPSGGTLRAGGIWIGTRQMIKSPDVDCLSKPRQIFFSRST